MLIFISTRTNSTASKNLIYIYNKCQFLISRNRNGIDVRILKLHLSFPLKSGNNKYILPPQNFYRPKFFSCFYFLLNLIYVFLHSFILTIKPGERLFTFLFFVFNLSDFKFILSVNFKLCLWISSNCSNLSWLVFKAICILSRFRYQVLFFNF